MRFLDKRFAGVAEGVGTANILGRIHSAQIRLGELYLPCAFSVLEGRAVDLLFGLDMLVRTAISVLSLADGKQKRHQCCIDLSTNTLRINNTEVPFLSEHELPDKARRREVADIAEEMGDAASQGKKAGVAGDAVGQTGFPGSGQAVGGSGTSSSSIPKSGTEQFADADIQTVSFSIHNRG